jgi:hypothetical protein
MAKKSGRGKGLMGGKSKKITVPMGGVRKLPKAPKRGGGQ